MRNGFMVQLINLILHVLLFPPPRNFVTISTIFPRSVEYEIYLWLYLFILFIYYIFAFLSNKMRI